LSSRGLRLLQSEGPMHSRPVAQVLRRKERGSGRQAFGVCTTSTCAVAIRCRGRGNPFRRLASKL